MKPKEFIKTIYLGDRYCKSIVLDGVNRKISLQIDAISRVRSESGNWELYTKEDIEDGFVVFTGVEDCKLENNGYLPNDAVEISEVKELETGKTFIKIWLASVDKAAYEHKIILEFVCDNIHLLDPKQPGVEIST